MIAYITGTSSGIGLALANKLLSEGHQVIGMSRRCSISHSNYEHIYLDLSKIDEVINFDFKANLNDNVLLVNNAGIIGPIKPIGHQIDEEILKVNTINIIAPELLCNKFIHRFKEFELNNYHIINISSGAGKQAIDAWSTYCASKAAIDLFSETIAAELKIRNHKNWNIHSIAPGVIDTPMQEEIRNSNPKDFVNHQKFVELKINNELVSSKRAANLYYQIIENPSGYPNVLMSLRDL